MGIAVAVQQAIYDRLRAASALTAVLASNAETTGSAVYDHVPQSATPEDAALFPFVVVGDDDHEEFDTDTDLGFESELTIHVWSRRLGREEVKTIQGILYDTLHRAVFSLSGYYIVTLDFVREFAIPDEDNRTAHGVSIYRLLSGSE